MDKLELYRLFEDKTRFINKLPIEDNKKEEYKNFFKSHSTLESKIDWNIKNPEILINNIEELIKATLNNSREKEEKKKGYKGDIDWEAHDCEYIGTIKGVDYIYVKSYEGAVFCDSAECGGAGAKWCIGTENNSYYWEDYSEYCVFVMTFNPKNLGEELGLKYMLQLDLSEDEIIVWDQQDESEEYGGRDYEAQLQEIELFKKIKVINHPQESYDKFLEDIIKNLREKAIQVDFKKDPFKYLKNYLDILSKGTDFYQEEIYSVNIKDPFIIYPAANQSYDKDSRTIADLVHEWLQRRAEYITFDEGCSKYPIYVPKKNFLNSLFHGFSNLKKVDLKNFNISGYVDYMFYMCSSLKEVLNLNLSECVSSRYSFCKSGVTSIDASTFYNIQYAEGMFEDCDSLHTINNPRFDNLYDATTMFKDCARLVKIDIGTFKFVQWMEACFKGCTSLEQIDNFDNLNDLVKKFSHTIYMNELFNGCKNLKFSNLSDMYFLTYENLSSIFKQCFNIDYLDLSVLDRDEERARALNERVERYVSDDSVNMINELSMFGSADDRYFDAWSARKNYKLKHFIPTKLIPKLNLYVEKMTGATPIEDNEIPWSYRDKV